jgi:hypothetical protein
LRIDSVNLPRVSDWSGYPAARNERGVGAESATASLRADTPKEPSYSGGLHFFPLPLHAPHLTCPRPHELKLKAEGVHVLHVLYSPKSAPPHLGQVTQPLPLQAEHFSSFIDLSCVSQFSTYSDTSTSPHTPASATPASRASRLAVTERIRAWSST